MATQRRTLRTWLFGTPPPAPALAGTRRTTCLDLRTTYTELTAGVDLDDVAELLACVWSIPHPPRPEDFVAWLARLDEDGGKADYERIFGLAVARFDLTHREAPIAIASAASTIAYLATGLHEAGRPEYPTDPAHQQAIEAAAEALAPSTKPKARVAFALRCTENLYFPHSKAQS